MPAFEWVHVQLHQQKGMISLSPPTICNSAKKGYHDDASIAAAQKKTATDSVNIDDKTMDSLKMNLILSQVLNIQGTPATIIGDQMVAGAIPADELEGLVKEQLAKARGQ
ncbi:secreted protein, suppressor for copper-sensitivity ScsC [Klebsiella pneumoniae]|nr:secreted protein, suppressor for copper-sensitivity ScsC [Klebsiella pneumoniae]